MAGRPLNICVYGSSSRHTPEVYLAAASELGTEMARRGHTCVNGAGAHGVMGALNRTAKAAGGKVIGVCHRMFVDGEITGLFEGFELVLTGGDDLVDRKRALAERADCFIALPGGPGTWDELWEVACARQLGVGKSGPICLVNTDGYYDGFVLQLERAHADRLLHKPPKEFLQVCSNPIEALDWCEVHVGEPAGLADTVVVGGAAAAAATRGRPAMGPLAWFAMGAAAHLFVKYLLVVAYRSVERKA